MIKEVLCLEDEFIRMMPYVFSEFLCLGAPSISGHETNTM